MVLTSSVPLVAFSMLLALMDLVEAASYDMVKEYSGKTFFDEWTFYNHFDNLTNGNVQYLSASDAFKSKLAFVDPTTNHAIMKVDNTSNVEFNSNRNSVRLQTDVKYSVGSVWIVDMLHVPFGCAVWPAWWSVADTREGGEIDTFEGVNLASHSIMGLHTLPGCTQVGQNQSSTIVNSTDCSFLANDNQGCISTVKSTQSYGSEFAKAGGGVFGTEFAESGISIWFFPRAEVPDVLSSNSSSIDTSSFGQPVGNWPSTQCNSSEFFQPQHLIFVITLCGDLAGRPEIFSQTCPGVCYNDHVLGDGSNFADAYFEVASVRVFSKEGTSTVVGVPKTSSTRRIVSISRWGGLVVAAIGLTLISTFSSVFL
ncbi:putative glycosidase C21B10.07 [Psilocybe cubensis]|uniref:Glycosidase C21B10.07 n=2 Tax=Psilocybe cubensis TaxID=181762 RepID=A0ACB8GXS4_PSICU|nr:putative glycosidase C21B10.07 [Psilocybe cubensis]KAH9480242.1 putative glycosidase C21B10.07 [Psilocybe cubensis]